MGGQYVFNVLATYWKEKWSFNRQIDFFFPFISTHRRWINPLQSSPFLTGPDLQNTLYGLFPTWIYEIKAKSFMRHLHLHAGPVLERPFFYLKAWKSLQPFLSFFLKHRAANITALSSWNSQQTSMQAANVTFYEWWWRVYYSYQVHLKCSCKKNWCTWKEMLTLITCYNSYQIYQMKLEDSSVFYISTKNKTSLPSCSALGLFQNLIMVLTHTPGELFFLSWADTNADWELIVRITKVDNLYIRASKPTLWTWCFSFQTARHGLHKINKWQRFAKKKNR